MDDFAHGLLLSSSFHSTVSPIDEMESLFNRLFEFMRLHIFIIVHFNNSCPARNGRAPIVPSQIWSRSEIKAREKLNRRHMGDIPRVEFFAQHR